MFYYDISLLFLCLIVVISYICTQITAPNIQPNNVPKLKAVYKGRKKERKQEKISSKKTKNNIRLEQQA